MTRLALLTAILLALSGCGAKPQPDCLTDTECQQWAIEQGWPEERMP